MEVFDFEVTFQNFGSKFWNIASTVSLQKFEIAVVSVDFDVVAAVAVVVGIVDVVVAAVAVVAAAAAAAAVLSTQIKLAPSGKVVKQTISYF